MQCKQKHSHKKRKDSLDTRAVPLIFSLELEISGVAVKSIHQNSEKWWLLEGIAQWKRFEAVLATFCCYDHGAKASKAVQKIATDQKEYRKCYSCMCYNLQNSQSIPINKQQWKMVGYNDTSDVAKKAAEVAQKKEQ